jgi:hypothetical protein
MSTNEPTAAVGPVPMPGPAVEPKPLQAPAADEDDRVDLGVLLVHGIGEQRQGQTLSQFGEPIIDWIRDWLFRLVPPGTGVAARPVNGRLAPPLLGDRQPAHAEVLIGTDLRDGAAAQRWLFAEAWWAPQVLVPSIPTFTGWLLTRGSWLLLFHFHQRWLSAPDAKLGGRILCGLLVLVVWFVLSTIANIALVAASLAAIVPLASVRRLVYSALRAVAGIVGDSFVLLRSPFQRVAFEEAAREALAWLRPRCKRLAVIAHSQGAVIARAALARDDAPPADLLVTVGAGITKIEALSQFERLPANERISASLAPALLLLGAFVALRVRQIGLDDWTFRIAAPGMLVIFGASMLLVAWLSVRRILDGLRERPKRLSLSEVQAALNWVDLYASHDPVPAGNLTRYFDLPGVRSEEIRVLGSVLRDHTSYWTARATFLPKLVEQLGRCAQTGLFELSADDGRVMRGGASHVRSLRLLTLSNWLDAMALTLPLTLAVEPLIAKVDAVRERLVRRPTDSTDAAPFAFIEKAAASTEQALRLIADVIAGSTANWAHGAVNWVAAAAALAVLLLVWKRIAFAMWQTWAGNRYEQALRDEPAVLAVAERIEGGSEAVAMHKISRWILDGVFAAILAAPLALSATWTFRPDWVSEQNAYVALGTAALLFVVVLMAAAMVADMLGKLTALRKRAAGRSRGEGWRWREAVRRAKRFASHARSYVVPTLVLTVVIGSAVSKFAGWNTAGFEETMIHAVVLAFVVYLVANQFEVLWSRMDNMNLRSLRRGLTTALPLVVLVAACVLFWRNAATVLNALVSGGMLSWFVLLMLTALHRAGKAGA